MAILIKALTTFGLLILAHAVYSTYEYTVVFAARPSTLITSLPASVTSSSKPPLPLDIRLETIFSTLLLLGAIILSAPPLRPIRWREWAGRIEREGWDPAREGREGKGDGDEVIPIAKGGKGNPYQIVEARRGFWDVRAARKEFADWVREGAGK